MTRRALLLAVPQVVLRQQDDWVDFQKLWNPFAEKLNAGVLDAKLLEKVVREINRIAGKTCR